MEEEDLPEILQILPDGAEDFEIEMITEHPGQARTGHAARQSDERIQYSCHFPCLLMATPKVSVGSRVKEVIARRLLMLDRTTSHQKTSRTPAPGNPLPEDRILGKGPSLCSSSSHFGRTYPETVLVVTEGSEGVLDTGASRTVVGVERLQEVLQGLSESCRKGIKRVSSEITFRFGSSGTLSSKYALLLPSSSGSWVRLEVIPGHTPLLISNKLLREMDAVIHVRKGFVQVGQVWVPTRFDERGLSLVDLASLLQCTPEQACLTASDMSRKHHKHELAPPVGVTTEHLPATRSLDNSCPPAQPTSALTLRSCPADPTPSQAGHAGDPQASAFRVQSLSGSSGSRPSLVGGGEKELGGDQFNLRTFKDATYSKPPGIVSLRQWGATIVPEGKHKGSSHEEIFNSDFHYSILMARKTTLTSAWSQSFANYVVARLKMAANQAKPKTTKGKTEGYESEDWGIVGTDPEMDSGKKGQSKAKPKMTAKRTIPKTSRATSSNMTVDEITETEKMSIATRKALLLRELAILERLQQPPSNLDDGEDEDLA